MAHPFFHKHCHIGLLTRAGFSDIIIKMTSLHPCVNANASLCTGATCNWLGGNCKKKTIRNPIKHVFIID